MKRITLFVLIFSWLPKPEFLNEKLVQIKPSIFTDILLYNIPDTLWFLSAILFLRFLWFYKTKEKLLGCSVWGNTGFFINADGQ
jgi:hypothetical protein